MFKRIHLTYDDLQIDDRTGKQVYKPVSGYFTLIKKEPMCIVVESKKNRLTIPYSRIHKMKEHLDDNQSIKGGKQ